MPSYKDRSIMGACKALTKQAPFRESLLQKYGAETGQLIIHCFRAQEILPPELGGAIDNVVDFLVDEAPVVKEYGAEQDKGVYDVTIRGFTGAYFVHANEYDDSEVFLTLKEAKSYVMSEFGEFLC